MDKRVRPIRDFRWFRAASILALAAAPGMAGGAGLSWQGEWHLNAAESQYPPGFPDIHDHVTHVTRDDGSALEYTDSFTIGSNPPTSVSFAGAYDGKPHAMSDGQMMAFFHMKHGYRDSWVSPTGTKGKDSCVFSNGGAKLTCHGAFTAPGAKPVTFVEVWDKAS
jgi:hypothetical protein